MTDSITVQANAKLNLFLRVLSKDEDGYHSLETLFARLALADDLTATRRDARNSASISGSRKRSPWAGDSAVAPPMPRRRSKP